MQSEKQVCMFSLMMVLSMGVRLQMNFTNIPDYCDLAY